MTWMYQLTALRVPFRHMCDILGGGKKLTVATAVVQGYREMQDKIYHVIN